MVAEVGSIGLWSPARQWPSEVQARAGVAAEIEGLGFPVVWLGAARGDLELPAAMLDGTERLVVGTSILNVWTEPADVVADHYAMLAKAHPDRILLGLGVGHAGPVEAATGRPYRRPVQVLLDYLDTLDELGVPQSDRLAAALGPRMLGVAAQRTAGALPYLTTPEHTQQARAILGPGPLLAPELMVVLEVDPDRARAIARQGLRLYLQLPNYTNNLRRLGFTDADLAGTGSDRLVDGLVAWGEPEYVLERVKAHHAAGADHVALQVLTATRAELPRAEWARLAAALAG